MPALSIRLQPGDVVGVHLPPGQRWFDIAQEVWAAEAALFPIDDRLAAPLTGSLIERVQPTVLLDADGVRRLPSGVPATPDVALVMATSGTTGPPQLVELRRSAIEAAIRASATVLGCGPDDPWLACLPLAHIGGLLVVLRGVILGAPVRIHEGFDVASFIEALQTDHIAFTSLVPTALHRVLDSGADLGDLRAVLVGGAAVPDAIAARLNATSTRCVATYGQTQTCGGVVYNGVPLPGTGLRIAPEGEVEIGGATIMTRYRDDADATRNALTPDGWLRTGDVGFLNDDGLLRIQGRLSECINSGGEKIWPAAVEECLRTHPLVKDIAVVGVPDATWGECAVAIAIPANAHTPPSLRELREYVAARLASYMAPRELFLVDTLPTTALGKPQRAVLQEQAASLMQQHRSVN